MISILRFSSLMLAALFLSVLGLNLTFVSDSDSDRTFLVVGFDDSSWHTDVLAIAKYAAAENSITIFQIPRDTFYNFGASQNKINQLTATAIANGTTPKDAICRLRNCLEDQFGIEIDNYIAATTDAFLSMVNALGTVSIKCEEEYIFRGRDGEILLSIEKGENELTPDQALLFVRHRYGYQRGDLDRLNVQKVFFKGLIESLLRSKNPSSLMLSFLKNGGIYSDVSFYDAFSLASIAAKARTVEINAFT